MTTHDAVTVATLINYPAEAAVEIVEGTIYLSRPSGFDIADLELLPEDGRRHELLDGVIVVGPSPRRLHQRAVTRLTVILSNAAPAGFEVLVAPFDIQAGPRTVVEPDVLVLPGTDARAPVPLPGTTARPPTGRGRGCAWPPGSHGWTATAPRPPARYVEVARSRGDSELTVSQPYDIVFVPGALVT